MIDDELLRQSEISVNKQSRVILMFFGGICIAGCLFVLMTDDPTYMKLDLINCGFLFLCFALMHIISRVVPVDSSAYKYCFLMWIFLPIMVEVVLTTDYFWMAFVIPILLSCRYYNVRLVVIVSVVTQFCLVIASLGVSYIQPYLGYAHASSISLPFGYTIAGDGRSLNEIASELLVSNIVEQSQYRHSHYWSHVIYFGIILISVSVCCVLITMHEVNTLRRQSTILAEKHSIDVKLAEKKTECCCHRFSRILFLMF